MNLRLFCFLSLLLAAIASPHRCPEKCSCNLDSEAECTSLNITRFGLEIFKLKIVKSPDLKLSFEVFKKLGLESLTSLQIENSTIVELNKDAFTGIPLNEITIKNTVLPEIPNMFFEPLPELTLVYFLNNTLTKFEGIQSSTISQLVLSQCGITKIEQACRNCTELSYLDLSYNQIERMSSVYSLGVDNLNVSHNKIKSVDFEIDINLATVDLSYNPIEKITGDSEVEKLFLKSCGLKDLSFLQEFSLLTYLDASDNKLRSLETDVFNKLQELKTLDLSNNKLTMLDNDVFLLNNRLSKLVLDRNYLKTLPQFITDGNMLGLDYFSCDNCGIETLQEDTFRHTPSILTIILRNNHLVQFPEKLFQYVPSLVSLDLTNNSITRIKKDSFKRNANLKVINLSGNPLQSVDPVIFAYNKVLKVLDLNNCKLRNLWNSTQTKIPSLLELRAKDNLIESITKQELDVTKNLAILILKGNTFDCDKFHVIENWIDANSVNVHDMYDYQDPWLDRCNTDYDRAENYDETDFYDDKDPAVKISEDDIKVDDYGPVYTAKPVNIAEDDFKKDDQLLEDAILVTTIESGRFSKEQPRREIIVFLLPTLVFVLTALIVLVFTVSAILCILYKRNRKPNAPQINIIPWSSTPKIKKHSGSVYRPLSEEKIPV